MHVVFDRAGVTTWNAADASAPGKTNAIARTAQCMIEFRSTRQRDLDYLKSTFSAIVRRTIRTSGVSIITEVIADEPTGGISAEHPLCKAVRAVQRGLGLRSRYATGNNDADLAYQAGIPAVTTGSSLGYKTHSLDEYVIADSVALGLKQNLSAIVAVAKLLALTAP